MKLLMRCLRNIRATVILNHGNSVYCSPHNASSPAASVVQYVLPKNKFHHGYSTYADNQEKTKDMEKQSEQFQRMHSSPEGYLMLVTEGQVTDIKKEELYKHLNKMHSTDILLTFAANHENFDKYHLAISMKRLFVIQKTISNNRRTEFVSEIYNDPWFQTLCATLTKKGPYYQATIAMDIFRFLRSFGFHDNHPAVLVYVQLLKHHLNDLHLDQLADLAHLISEMNETSNVRLIIAGVKALVATRTHEFKALSLPQKLILLSLFSSELDERWQKTFLTWIKQDLDTEFLEPQVAVLMLQAFSRCSCSDTDLEEEAIRVIEDQLDSLSQAVIQSLIQSLSVLCLYCPDVFNRVGNLAIEQSWTPRAKLQILSDFCELSFIHQILADDLLKDCEQMSDQFSETDWLLLLGCCSSLRLAVPVEVKEHLQKVVGAVDIENFEMENVVDLALSLLVIGLQPSAPIYQRIAQQITSSSDISSTFQPQLHGGYAVSLLQVLTILATHYPELAACTDNLPEATLATEMGSHGLMELPDLHSALQVAAASAKPEIKPHYCLENGLTVDYLLEDIGVASDTNVEVATRSNRVSVVVLPSLGFTKNHQKLKGVPKLFVEAVQSLNISVLVTTEAGWMGIPHHEKVPYLRKKLAATRKNSNQLVIIT